jgi:hypothetical protein
MNSTTQETSSQIDLTTSVDTKPICSVVDDMSPAKNDMNVTETTESSSEIGKSEQIIIPADDYTDSWLNCSARLLKNCALGLFIDAVKWGLFSLE